MSETKKETNTEQPQTETVEEKQPQTESVEKTETVENTQTKAETKTKTEKPKIVRQEGTAKPAVKSAAVKSAVSKGTKCKQGKFSRVDY